MCRDALAREESCGCHFRSEHVREDGEGARDDARFAHVAAWMHTQEDVAPRRLTEALRFESVAPGERSYR